MKEKRFVNLRTVMISKEKRLRLPDEVIEKLKINIHTDVISFVLEDGEVKLKVLRGEK